MGIWDRFGGGIGMQRNPNPSTEESDEQAIARYRYMLKTAPPETIEQAHADAFAALTPEQRGKVLQRLRDEMPEAERVGAASAGDSPGSLARVATRAEIRQPGAIERAFGGMASAPGSGAAGPGLGSMVAGSFLGSMAGTVLGSMVAQHFFGSHPEAHQLFRDHAHDDHSTADSGNPDHGIHADSDHTADATGVDTDIDSDAMNGFDGTDTWDV